MYIYTHVHTYVDAHAHDHKSFWTRLPGNMRACVWMLYMYICTFTYMHIYT